MKKPKNVHASVLDAAKAAVSGDRALNYGKPEDNFARIRDLWNTHIANLYGERAVTLNRADVAMMLILLKVARLENNPTHLDSWTDIAGYAACGAESNQLRIKK
jgi:hypothetical protein